MVVLGIESSCDETGVAIYSSKAGLIAHALYSQIDLHREYGGVVPELASRSHEKYLVCLTAQALKEAGIKKSQLSAIAYTAGPGLIGALLTGACFAKSLAFGLGIPALAVHHLEAHVLAAKLAAPQLEFPFLALLVSGGHTQLIEAKALGEYTLLGDTLDDAVGEAFDKTAKMMGLPYPGGAILATLADNSDGKADILAPFPRPMLSRPGLDFSFSGLKTHALMSWNRSNKDEAAQIAIACAFQEAAIDTLTTKCRRALLQTGIKRLVAAGGVSANQKLRKILSECLKELQGEVFFPAAEYCTDNGAMIAYAGWLHLQRGIHDSSLAIDVKPRWPLVEGM